MHVSYVFLPILSKLKIYNIVLKGANKSRHACHSWTNKARHMDEGLHFLVNDSPRNFGPVKFVFVLCFPFEMVDCSCEFPLSKALLHRRPHFSNTPLISRLILTSINWAHATIKALPFFSSLIEIKYMIIYSLIPESLHQLSALVDTAVSAARHWLRAFSTANRRDPLQDRIRGWRWRARQRSACDWLDPPWVTGSRTARGSWASRELDERALSARDQVLKRSARRRRLWRGSFSTNTEDFICESPQHGVWRLLLRARKKRKQAFLNSGRTVLSFKSQETRLPSQT